MAFIKEESEDMKIEETLRVKHEDTEEQTKMVFIKEESEDVKIEEAFRVKQEDTEEQTGWFSFSNLNSVTCGLITIIIMHFIYHALFLTQYIYIYIYTYTKMQLLQYTNKDM